MSLPRRWPSMRRTSHSISVRGSGAHGSPIWHLRRMGLLCIIVLCLSACIRPGGAAPVLKVGLVAPFEGLGRPLGYAVLPVVREVLDSANASGELGSYRLLLVALNDDLDPAAAVVQAAALAEDASVIAVIGPFTMPTAAQAAPILSAAGIPAVVAAPLDAPLAGIHSLCPDFAVIASEIGRVVRDGDLFSCSENAIDMGPTTCAVNPNAAALSEADFMVPGERGALVYWPGEAAEAAAWLADDRNVAFEGVLLGGPDLLKPWFVKQAGAPGEGSRAVACSLRGVEVEGGELPEVALARAATERLVQAMAARIQTGADPTRAEIATELLAQKFEPSLVWYEVRDGAWRTLADP